MRMEHLIFALGIAVSFGMIYRRITGKELSWLIVVSAYTPDFDIIADRVFDATGINILMNGAHIHHGDFHNIGILLMYAISLAFLLSPLGFRFRDSFIFAGIGFGAHLIEDAMVFSPAYRILWPLTTLEFGFGSYNLDFYRIADTKVLIWGIIFLVAAVALRTLYERKIWWKELITYDS